MKLLILFTMIWLHIIDDYYMQGKLAYMKRKEWWLKLPEYKSLFKYDYIVALICHAFSWSFIVHIPSIILAYFYNRRYYIIIISILMHMVIHAYIDHIKANKKEINLILDQSLHLFQLIIIFLLCVL